MANHSQIYHYSRELRALQSRSALAMVTHAEGSTYRKTGARCLIGPDGEMLGLIGGGCLEEDLRCRGKRVIETGIAERVCFDGRSEDDIMGFALGCNGLVEVLIVPDESLSWCDVPALLDQASKGAGGIYLVHLVEAPDSMCQSLGPIATSINSEIEFAPGTNPLLREHICMQWERNSGIGGPPHWQSQVEGARLLFERLPRSVSLGIVGAGLDVKPVVHLAHLLGWNVTVYDFRPGWLEMGHLDCQRVYVSRERFADPSSYNQHDVWLVMTHNFEMDSKFIEALVHFRDLIYVGLLGPKQRGQRLLEISKVAGTDREALFRAPVGLDIGADSAEEIALAIVSEIQAVHRGRSGSPLCQRVGSIHDPDPNF